jgi:hypothetical protein
VLGDLRRRRGLNVGDLVAALRPDVLAFQAGAAGPHSAGGYQYLYFGLSTSLIVVPGSPGCLPGARFPFSRSDRSRGGFFLYGLSDDEGFDDVPEFFAAWRSSRSTRVLSSLISRYASASRAASSSCGRAASSSAVGRAGSAGTAPPCHPERPRAARDRNRDQPATSP